VLGAIEEEVIIDTEELLILLKARFDDVGAEVAGRLVTIFA